MIEGRTMNEQQLAGHHVTEERGMCEHLRREVVALEET